MIKYAPLETSIKRTKMPQKRSACKEIRKSKKKHAKNIAVTSEIKTLIKSYNDLLSQKKFSEAKTFLASLSSKLQKAAKKGIIRKITVSRKISRLAKKLNRASLEKK